MQYYNVERTVPGVNYLPNFDAEDRTIYRLRVQQIALCKLEFTETMLDSSRNRRALWFLGPRSALPIVNSKVEPESCDRALLIDSDVTTSTRQISSPSRLPSEQAAAQLNNKAVPKQPDNSSCVNSKEDGARSAWKPGCASTTESAVQTCEQDYRTGRICFVSVVF
jgi:hypothetical protein